MPIHFIADLTLSYFSPLAKYCEIVLREVQLDSLKKVLVERGIFYRVRSDMLPLLISYLGTDKITTSDTPPTYTVSDSVFLITINQEDSSIKFFQVEFVDKE